jgi:hypothetical protein
VTALSAQARKLTRKENGNEGRLQFHQISLPCFVIILPLTPDSASDLIVSMLYPTRLNFITPHLSHQLALPRDLGETHKGMQES